MVKKETGNRVVGVSIMERTGNAAALTALKPGFWRANPTVTYSEAGLIALTTRAGE